MDPSRLLRDELEYELRVRGLETEGNVPTLRKRLTSAMSEGAGPIREVQAALPVAQELEVCQRKAADLSALVEGIEGGWTSEEVRKVEAKAWHLYRRVVVLNGTEHQNDVRDHLAESLASLQATLVEEKGKLAKRKGVGSTPPPSSPALPDAVGGGGGGAGAEAAL